MKRAGGVNRIIQGESGLVCLLISTSVYGHTTLNAPDLI